eukprot:gene10443-11362_t
MEKNSPENSFMEPLELHEQVSHPNWEHLVGRTGHEAKEMILKERSSLHVHVVPANAMVTMDYRTDRVRIYVDSEGKVARAPVIG